MNNALKSKTTVLLLRFFRWYCKPDLIEDIEGDLLANFHRTLRQEGPAKAKRKLAIQIILLFRPGIIRIFNLSGFQDHFKLIQHFVISWRRIKSNLTFSLINIGGLGVGMAIAMLIGLWVWDELSFNKSFTNYTELAQLYQNRTFDGQTGTYKIVPQPMSRD